jgi:hypothetical protein
MVRSGTPSQLGFVIKGYDTYPDMKRLVIKDNFLDENELKEILNIINGLSWKYGASSGDSNSVRFWISHLNNEKRIIDIISPKIEKISGLNLEIERVYANGQTYGQDGEFHTDHESYDRYTFILYVSPIFPENVDIVGGFTQFKIDNQIVNVEPYQNRGCLFKSNIFHRGLAPSREVDMLRVTLAFKMKRVFV